MERIDVETRLLKILGAPEEAVRQASSLSEAGWDSLAMIELMAWLGTRGGREAESLRLDEMTIDEAVVAILELFDAN
jgi:acyl carrier protein